MKPSGAIISKKFRALPFFRFLAKYSFILGGVAKSTDLRRGVASVLRAFAHGLPLRSLQVKMLFPGCPLVEKLRFARGSFFCTILDLRHVSNTVHQIVSQPQVRNSSVTACVSTVPELETHPKAPEPSPFPQC